MFQKLLKTLGLVLLLLSSAAFAETSGNQFYEVSSSAMTKTQFRSTVATARRLFSYLAENNGRRLEFFTDWDSDWAQAFARRWESDQILIHGGIARIPGGNVDSLALLICHELGHLYGGTPYSDSHNSLSAEGQADWWATKECWPVIAPALSSDVDIGGRGQRAALVATAFYAANRGLSAPKVSTPDPSEVGKTLLTHPEPQCRLDTYVAGLKGQERPRCWWAPE